MNVIPEEVAWAHLVMQVPADPRVHFGGVRLIRERKYGADIIRNMVQGLQPIAQKKDNDELAILKKILQMSQGAAAAPKMQRPPPGVNFGAQQVKHV